MENKNTLGIAYSGQASSTPVNYGSAQPRSRWKAVLAILAILLVVALIVGGSIWLALLNKQPSSDSNQFNNTQIDLSDVNGGNFASSDQLTILGQLNIDGGFAIAPTTQPTNPKPGQLYYDQDTNLLNYYNGSKFINLSGSDIQVGDGLENTDGVLIGNGTSAITSVTADGAGLCLQSTAGAPAFLACPGGGSNVTSLNGLSGALTLANATALGDTVTINDATNATKGIASFNSTNFSVSSGAVTTTQDISISSSPTFANLTLSGDLAVNGGDITSTGTLGVTAVGGLTLTSSGSGDITLDAVGNIELVDNTNVTGTLSTTSTVTLGALGSTDTSVHLCRNNANQIAACTGSGLTIGAIDSQTKSNDGAVLSADVIYLQTADEDDPGLVSTGAQTFAGNKTFTGTVTQNSDSPNALQLKDSTSTSTILNVDSSNGRLGVGTDTPSEALTVIGGMLLNTTATFFGGNGANFGSFGTGTDQFDDPVAVAVDSVNNKLFIVDEDNGRIARVDSGSGGTTLGANWQTFGTTGSGANQFSNPIAIAVDMANNKVFVSDRSNSRIARFDSGGGGTTFGANWQSFGTNGAGANQFNNPYQVIVDTTNNKMYVADNANDRIAYADSGGGGTTFGANWQTFGTSGFNPGEFGAPRGLALDLVNNKLFVGDWGNGYLVRFDSGTGGTTIGDNWEFVIASNEPTNMAIDTVNNKLYVANFDSSVNRYDTGGGGTTFGANKQTFGSDGSGANQFSWLYGVALDSVNHTVYVAEFANDRVSKLDDGFASNTGSAFRVLNGPGTPLFTVDTSLNRVYIGDSTTDNIAALLVLDSADNFGDPDGADGAMYYNSKKDKFRCYTAGYWGDCGGMPRPNSGRTTYFAANGSNTTMTGYGDLLGTQAATTAAGTNNFPYVNYTTNTTIGNSAGAFSTATGAYGMGVSRLLYQARVTVVNPSTNIRHWAGFTNQSIATMSGSATPTGSYAAFRYDTSAGDTTIKCVVRHFTGSQVIADSGVSILGNSQRLYEVLIAGSSTRTIFRINGIEVCDVALGPGSNMGMHASLTTLDAVTKTLSVFWLYVEQQLYSP